MSRRQLLATVAIVIAYWVIFFGSLWVVGAFASCTTHGCWHRVSVRRHETWLRAHRPWLWEFRRLPAGARAWTRCVSWAESRDHRVTAGAHHSYFQWTLSTWYSAGGHGAPEAAGWHQQAVRAWRWHVRVPNGQWPATGEGGRCGS